MKLIFAIVNKEDSNAVQDKLIESGFFVTRLATTGGFLRSKSITFLIGTEEQFVDDAIDVISKYSKKRTQLTPSSGGFGVEVIGGSMPPQVVVGGATVFVVDVDRFEKL